MSEFKVGDKVHVVPSWTDPAWTWVVIQLLPRSGMVKISCGELSTFVNPDDLIPAEPPTTPEPAPTGKLQTWGEIIDYENMIEEFKRLTKVYHHVRAIQQSDDAYLGDSPDIDERVIEAAGDLAEFVDTHADVIIAALSRED